MLLIAGDCDPVGDYGSGVRKVWAMLGDAGVRDLTCQIFEGGRHELAGYSVEECGGGVLSVRRREGMASQWRLGMITVLL